MSTSTLDSLDYTEERLEFILARLAEDHPTIAAVTERLLNLTADGQDDDEIPDQASELMDVVYAESGEMRRSHLAVVLALAADAQQMIQGLLAGVDEARLPDPDALDNILQGLEEASAPLADLALNLSRPREREEARR
ncbi:hypothetical protein [Actinomadura terrae]|uniref:hypothetical protein n=1 Tax=Actinomadura terrae TaxID=604353 RepID=UPI001FA801DD|nr:hypothetical protein [Actinomadura terrae]